MLFAKPVESSPKSVTITYPSNYQSPIYQEWERYFHDLLKLAVKKAKQPATLKQVKIPTLPNSRSVGLINSGHYDIDWISTDSEREEQLRAIKIPLYKGLLGWRIFFIHQEQQPKFSNIDSIKQLQLLTGGLGIDWPDTKIMKDNGFTIYESGHSFSLIDMLDKQRIDYFSRSILEIWREQDQLIGRPIKVESTLALQYESAIYFFVKKDNDLAFNVVSTGLNNAIEDGSFDALFCEYFADDLQKSQLQNRRVFSVVKPAENSAVPLKNQALWFDPLTNICQKNLNK